jgi:branched-chain amino acid transport system ATP-binding protein
MSSLSVSNFSAWYHKAQVLTDISLKVEKASFVSIVGANGAGKTTLLRGIINIHNSKSGHVEFFGEEISRVPTYRLIRKGLTFVPDYRGILRSLTVKENLATARYIAKSRADFDTDLDSVMELFPNLKYRSSMAAGLLSGGEQQMLAIARALMYHPLLLLIDEPSIGLAPLLVEDIFQKLKSLIARGMSILMVEQNVKRSLKACDYCYVLEKGRIILEGKSEEISKNQDLHKFYLGIKET